jgi:hypothetical protein
LTLTPVAADWRQPNGGAAMKFYITALDTSGTVTLHRDSVPAAIKKASELISDGCLNVEIVMPDGATYRRGEFEQLKERIGA